MNFDSANQIKLLGDVIRVAKAKNEDFVFVTNECNVAYVLNSERSVLKRVVYPENIFMPEQYHVAGAIKSYKVLENTDTDDVLEVRGYDSIYYDLIRSNHFFIMNRGEENPYLYTQMAMNISRNCKDALAHMQQYLNNSTTVIHDTDDMITDSYYSFVFDSLFDGGTGKGDIIKTKSGYSVLMYKGLIPYTSKDGVSIDIHQYSPTEFISAYRVYKLKPKKNDPYMDMYLRQINLFASR